MYTLELKNVRKAYGKFVAVNDLSFNIEAGTMFGLLGPNGAGKTSTIRMMIGITMPDSGQVLMFGKPFERDALSRVGYLPEERGLYPKMNVLDQLMFMGQLHGLTAGQSKERALNWGRRLQIIDAYVKKTQELSKGMQQKIQFIATLLHDPQLIIMDEPFAGLDPANSKLLQDVLLDLRNQGKTILFSTHRMDQVEKLCNNICLVNKGKAVLHGDLREIKSRYGRNTVQMAFDGGGNGNNDGDYLSQIPTVNSLDRYEGYIQLKLAPGADAQQLLQTVSQRSRLNRFEVMEPSLEDIFIEVVGKADA
jgi:ABC-2 type transport system ATP-binding protein